MSPGEELDAHAQPLNTRLNAARISDRTVDELVGICKAFGADGQVSQDEALFLEAWLKANAAYATRWPADVLCTRLQAALADRSLSSEEGKELLATLHEIAGAGATSPAAAVENLSSTLPFDKPAPAIAFAGRSFCFTGKFAFGPRKLCEAEVLKRGGALAKDIEPGLGYLVVGLLGSRDWIHTSFGRKIEAAVAFRAAGQKLVIVGEEHWAKSLEVRP